jgi:glycosyltransferase involved in cell wall biosynthesis
MSSKRLLLVTDAVGGVWTYSIELALALRPLGIESIIAVIGPSPSRKQREEAADFKLVDTGLPLEWLDTSPAAIRRAGEIIAAQADRENANLVQTSSAALLAQTDFAQPCIAVQHSCVASWWAAVKQSPLPPDFEWRRELIGQGLRSAAAVVAPSVAFAAETARIYDVHAVAVHNGRSPHSSRAIPQGDFVFTAGRLWDEGKNVATLDAAAAKLSFPFQAAGATNGPNGALIDLKWIEPLGQLSQTRLRGALTACPIYASAALYEPFGLSVLEAAQAGCALVLSDIATHREIWGDAANFVAARDDAAFATAIEQLIGNPGDRQRLGQLAKARSALYTPERMARSMADIYARVAEPVRMAGVA